MEALSHDPCPFGQQVSETFAVDDLVDQAQEGLAVAEDELLAVDVFLLQYPALVEFHGHADRRGRPVFVDPVFIAEIVRLEDEGGVDDVGFRPQRVDRFVLGSLHVQGIG